MRLGYKILLVLLLSLALCEAVFRLYKAGDSRFNLHKKERLTELFLNHTNHELLFIGSSRTHTDIDPRIIDSLCHVDSYNAGVEGGNLLEFYYTYAAYLVNHPAPKYLVLGLDLWSFDLTRNFFNYTIYLNYTENPVIARMLLDNGCHVALYKWLPPLVLTDLDDYSKGNALAGLAGASEIAKGDFQYKGFLSNTDAVINPDALVNVEPAHLLRVDSVAVGFLNSIIKNTERTGTRLIFAYSPEYNHELQASFRNSDTILGMVGHFATLNHICNLRNDSLRICREASLFANSGHLNRLGAEVYSTVLAAQLLRIGVGM
jgi:hypothetical protein